MVLKKIIVIITLFLSAFGWSKDWGEWKNSIKQPTLYIPHTDPLINKISRFPFTTGDPEVSPFVPSTGAILPYLLVRLYQKTMRNSLHQCPSWPSCSRYSLLCLKKYGGFLGTLMTIDRLLFREAFYHIHRRNKIIWIDNKKRLYDPPENNYLFTEDFLEWKEKNNLTTKRYVKPKDFIQ